ncbi:MAG: hypothetical protein ABL860_01960 [Candidatus Nitrotoga sp.]
MNLMQRFRFLLKQKAACLLLNFHAIVRVIEHSGKMGKARLENPPSYAVLHGGMAWTVFYRCGLKLFGWVNEITERHPLCMKVKM